MNERIRELAEQAGSTHKQSLGVYQFYTDELEKFAELIVKECVEVSRQYNFHERSLIAMYEHFGMDATEIFHD